MTMDVDRRLTEHNQKLSNTHSTKKLTDYELVFCQIANNRSFARKLEKLLKSGWGREFRKEIVQYT
jgi:predicted GIY-YIG superfamily endonuclease